MNKYVFLLIAAVFIFSFSADAQTVSERWNLTQINGAAVGGTNAFLELQFANNRVWGNSGCNSFSGSVERNGNRVKFSKIITTRKYCGQNGVMKTEADFLDALQKTARFVQSKDSLKFYAGRRAVLTFTKAKNDSDAAKLNGKQWVLTAIENQLITLSQKQPHIVFDAAKSRAGGNGGCNAFGGSYKIENETITFGDIFSTEMYCENENRSAIERQMLEALSQVNRFVIEGKTLKLYAADKLLLAFEARN